MDSHTLNKNNHNHCSECRLAPICLPGSLDKSNNISLEKLEFHSRVLKPGEHLCHQGELLDHLFIVRSGLLKSYFDKEEGEEYVMGFYLPSELFGWEGIDPNQLSFSTVALDHSNVCEIPLEKLEALISRHPHLQKQLFQLINKRIRKNNISFLLNTAEQRVCHFIITLSRHFKMLGYPHDLCELTMTYQDIANYLRMKPETISRILHSLQDRNIITVGRKKIEITNFDHLQQACHFELSPSLNKKAAANS